MLFRFLKISTLLFLLSACSAHPGAGGWRATSEDAEFNHIEIRYDGKADLFLNKEDTLAAWRCFWGKVDQQTISLQCKQASDAKREQKYRLSVDSDTGIATLLLNDLVIGQYQASI